MKQKNANTDVVTKKDLLEAFENFSKTIGVNMHEEITTAITASETRILAKMESRFVESERTLLAKVEIKLADMELRIDDRARSYNSEILTRFDQWTGTYENISTDQTLTNNQVNKLRKTVDGHEKRITELEHN